MNKVIVWGHKDGHTHGYVHEAYYKAFKYLGYDTYWFDHNTNISNIDFKNSLFFTEHQAEKNMPLIKNCVYILHNYESKQLEKYIGYKYLNFGPYAKFCDENKSLEKINDFSYYNPIEKTAQIPYATDLLPHEINIEDACVFDADKYYINYVGSIWSENEKFVSAFKKACVDKNKTFKNYVKVSYADNKRLIRESYIAPDIRNVGNISSGIIPCRIFKNISYGQVTGTNSIHIYESLKDYVAYSEDCYNLFDACVDKHKSMSKEKIQESMLYVKDKHTYVSRINDLIGLLNKLY